MINTPSTSTWKEISFPILSTIQKSTNGIEISRENWPAWTKDKKQFKRLAVISLPLKNDFNINLPSTELSVLFTERMDVKDHPDSYNYNFYMLAETTDGRVFQSAPVIPTKPKHHSVNPSTWFEDLDSPI